jgi:flagellar hook protein FlgE
MSFQIALTGINAVNNQLETISNNIANTGTVGFKSSRTNFTAMYAGQAPNGVEASSLTQTLGVGGAQFNTGRNLDAAIQGEGFFMARDASGVMNYTRAGIFDIDRNGQVVDSANRRVQGFAAIAGTNQLGPLGDLLVPNGQIPARASDLLRYRGNLSADWQPPAVTPFDAADPQSFNSSTVSVVHDSLGVQHTISQYFVKSGVNEVTVRYGFNGTMLDTVTTLNFDTQGRLAAPTVPVPVDLPTPVGADAMDLRLDYAGTTQFAGDATTTTNTANGYPSGAMVGLKLESDGTLNAQYSNGHAQRVGTIALATFASQGGLTAVSGTGWVESVASGAPLVSTPGTGQAGQLGSGALEQSNVDITRELVELMGAQRNYQANTKVISAANEMMQKLMQAV